MNTPKQAPNNLVIYRRRMGLTQKAVAKILGYKDCSMVSHYEHSRSLPPLRIALGFEIIYRTPVAFLFPRLYDSLRNDLRESETSLAKLSAQDH